MNLWLVTSIRLTRQQPFRASSIQNIQTAMALAESGHRVLLWVAELGEGGRSLLEERMGRPLPAGLELLAYKPRGPKEEKKTPFNGPLDRLVNLARARWRGGRPDAIITRSPRALSQLRHTRLLPAGTRLILEYQYPEWALLWREWRRRHPQASLRECVGRLRAWRREEESELPLANGILYAAHGHLNLLHRANFAGPAQWLPSGCLPPQEGAPGEAELAYDLGYVGSLAPENGLESLLEALARLDDTRLLLVGGGREAYREGLLRRVGELKLKSRVEFAGAIDFQAVRAQMRRCRVGLVPISDRQGPEKRQFASPLKLIEWMAAGVPVVASAVPSVCQFVAHEANALLVAPADPAALAEAACRLLGDPALRRELTRRGLEAARMAAYPNRAALIVKFIQSIVP